MLYSILPQKKTIYIFQSQKQLRAAAGWLKSIDSGATHYKTNEGCRTFTETQTANGFDVVRVKTNNDAYRPHDFYIPIPGAGYLLKGFYY